MLRRALTTGLLLLLAIATGGGQFNKEKMFETELAGRICSSYKKSGIRWTHSSSEEVIHVVRQEPRNSFPKEELGSMTSSPSLSLRASSIPRPKVQLEKLESPGSQA